MEADKNNTRCPVCGGITAQGELSISGDRGALQWHSARKIPRKHPLRFFKDELFHQRQVKVRLMGLSLFGPDIPMSVFARYCPNCKKVFAYFDAPGVPPELCEEETTKQKEGAQ